MFCSNCGAPDMNGNYCRECGEKLSSLALSAHTKPKLMTAAEYRLSSSPMGLVDAVKICFNKFATFEGTASRSEFWLFAWFNLLVYSIWAVFVFLVSSGSTEPIAVFLFYLPVLIMFLPNLSVSIRRLHDAGYSGTFYLMFLIPLIGPVLYLIFMLQPTSKSK